MTPKDGWVKGVSRPRPPRSQPKWKVRAQERRRRMAHRRFNPLIDK